MVVVTAVVAGLVIWAITRLILGHDLMTTSNGNDDATAISPVAVGAESLIAGMIAWGVLVLLERFASRAGCFWLIIAVVVLAISLLGPLALASGTGSKVALIALHLVVGAILIAGFARTTSTH